MTFYFGILIAHPYRNTQLETWAWDKDITDFSPYECTTWEIEEIIYPGAANKLDFLTEKQAGPHTSLLGSNQRAATCFFDPIYDGLKARLDKAWRRGAKAGGFYDCFAPPFLVSPQLDDLNASGNSGYIAKKYFAQPVPAGEFVMPRRRLGVHTIPDLGHMMFHNQVVKLPIGELARHAYSARGLSLFRGPFIWVPCRTLGQWLLEFEHSKSDTREQLKFDPAAHARVRAWTASIVEWGKMGSRAIFYFDNIYGM